jgi:hypothetical protein
MSKKFEVGQKVRRIGGSTNGGMNVGDVGTVTYCDAGEIRFEEYTADVANCGLYAPTYYELISEPHYTKLKPKVGEKYRVVKKIPAVGFNPGDKIDYIHQTSFVRIPDGMSQWINEEQLTTEFLELITEPEKVNLSPFTNPDWYPGFQTEIEDEPINKSIIQKSMSFIKRLTQSADDKALLKARFTDDCGNLTSRGQEALTSLVFADKKADLVKLAEEVIAEEKE